MTATVSVNLVPSASPWYIRPSDDGEDGIESANDGSLWTSANDDSIVTTANE